VRLFFVVPEVPVISVPGEAQTFYMGSTGGGVWRTTDAGRTWVNLTDGQIPLGSMGAIEVSQSDPNIVYAGTGSSIRSNVSIGRGIYKSTDAGKTWTFTGLRDAGQIATVRVHPSNPGLVYLAALGNPFVPNPGRGVFRATDGGKTWTKVLFLSDEIGAAGLELQPGNPKTIFACMWHGQRKPWTIVSGGIRGGGPARARRRHLQEYRWRRHLDQTRRRPAQPTARPWQCGHLRRQPHPHLRPDRS